MLYIMQPRAGLMQGERHIDHRKEVCVSARARPASVTCQLRKLVLASLRVRVGFAQFAIKLK